MSEKSVPKFSGIHVETAVYRKSFSKISAVRRSRDSRHGSKVFFRVGEDDLCGYSRNIDSSEFRKLVTFLERNDKLARSLARDELFAVNFGQTLSSRGGYHESGGNCSRT